MGKKAKSTPYGSVDRPFNPLSLALGAEATFVARSVDVFQPHLKATLKQAAAHQGAAFVEILQNCNIFNDGAWDALTEKDVRDDHTIALEHGQPLVFGKNKDKGIRMNGLDLEVVTLGNGVTEKDLIVHDEQHPNPAYAFLLSRMDGRPGFPTPDRRAARRGRAALRGRPERADPPGHREEGEGRSRRSSCAPATPGKSARPAHGPKPPRTQGTTFPALSAVCS